MVESTLKKRGDSMPRTRRLLAALLLTAGVTLAQVDGVSVTVTQSVSAPPTLADLRINAVTDPSVSLDQMVERLQGVGVNSKNFVGLQSGGPLGSRIAYQFQFSTPLMKLKATLDALDLIRRTASDLEL